MIVKPSKKVVKVVAMVWKKIDAYFLVQKTNEKGGQWEFPGGKVEIKETNEEALVREIKEELELAITVLNFIGKTFVTIKTQTYEISFYKACPISNGHFKLLEHQNYGWYSLSEMNKLDLAESTKKIIKTLD